MDKQLNPETETALRKLAREISVAHDLDQEVQEELYGHMEDKALGYLSGEERVSQADVVLLTKEHFGDARRLKEFLSRVHHAEATVSLGRRLVAVIVAGLGIGVIMGLTRIVLAYALAWRIPYYYSSFNSMMLNTIGPTILYLIALFLTLKHWQKRTDRNEDVWFQRWTPGKLTAITLGLFILDWCIPVLQCNVTGSWPVPSQEEVVARVQVQNWLLSHSLFLTPLVWIWWLDRRPRRIQAVLLGSLAFCCYAMVRTFVMLTGYPSLVLYDTGSEFTFVHNTFFGGMSGVLATTFLRSSLGMAMHVGGALILYAALCVAARTYTQGRRGKPWIST